MHKLIRSSQTVGPSDGTHAAAARIDGQDKSTKATGGPRKAAFPILTGIAVAVFAGAIFQLGVAAAFAPSAAPKPSVGIVGDSITWRSESRIYKTLDPHYTVSVHARPRVTTHEQLGSLDSLVGAPGHYTDDLIVELGTNDAIKGATDSTWAGDFSAVLAVTSRTPCVILVTVSPVADFYGRGTRAEQINSLIASVARSHKNIHVLDWAGLLTTHGNQHRFIRSLDGIHPNVEGQWWLAHLYAEALRRDCPVPKSLSHG